MLAPLTAVNQTLDAVAMYKTVQATFQSLPFSEQVKGLGTMVLGFRNSLNSSVAKAGAVGAAIGGVATWAFFFAAWGKGGLSADSMSSSTICWPARSPPRW